MAAPRKKSYDFMTHSDVVELFDSLGLELSGVASEMARQMAVATLNVAVRATPPNKGGKRNRGKKDVKALQSRIIAEIIGGGDNQRPGRLNLPTAIPAGSRPPFRPVKWQGAQDAWGSYGFVIPRNPGKKRINYTDPEDILRQRYFRRHGNVVRATNNASPGWHWVRKTDLTRAIRRRTDAAGGLIASWAAAARFVGASNLRRDVLVSKHARAGHAQYIKDEHLGEYTYDIYSDWSGLIVYRFLATSFDSYVREAARGALKQVRKQFKMFS